MREILLTRGMVAVVDDDDFNHLNQWRWHASLSSGKYYAKRRVTISPWHSKLVAMHREILGLSFGSKERGDHVSGETLDNRRSNLRACTVAQNGMNRGPTKRNHVGLKGVIWQPKGGRWTAQIQANKVSHYLGIYATAEAAHVAYVAAALQYHGEFAHSEVVA